METKRRVTNQPMSSVEALITRYEERGIEAYVKRQGNEVYLIINNKPNTLYETA